MFAKSSEWMSVGRRWVKKKRITGGLIIIYLNTQHVVYEHLQDGNQGTSKLGILCLFEERGYLRFIFFASAEGFKLHVNGYMDVSTDCLMFKNETHLYSNVNLELPNEEKLLISEDGK